MRSGREKDTQQTVTWVVGRVVRRECERALIKSIVRGLHLDIRPASVNRVLTIQGT